MKRLYKQVEASFKRFPEGVEPYKMATRLLEKCGEVAREIHHFEDRGIKRMKYGEPSKENFANEIRQSLVALMQIAVYYNLEDELEKSIDDSLERMKREGLVE